MVSVTRESDEICQNGLARHQIQLADWATLLVLFCMAFCILILNDNRITVSGHKNGPKLL